MSLGHLLPSAPFGFGGCGAGFADAGEEFGSGFIRGVLGDKFACEGFGEDALIQPVGEFQGLLGLGGEAVDFGEGCFDPTDDFALFINLWNYETKRFQFLGINI